MSGPDRRLEPGAYISDGVRLYEVRTIRAHQLTPRLVVTDCRDERVHQIDVDKILRAYKLVRAAPVLQIPPSLPPLAA